MNAINDDTALRLDVFLYRTRFFKTRTAASTYTGKGRVRINRTGAVRRAKSGAVQVQPGDVLTFAQNRRIIMARIVQLPLRRGPASEAADCYVNQEADHV